MVLLGAKGLRSVGRSRVGRQPPCFCEGRRSGSTAAPQLLARKYTRTDYFVSEMSDGDSSYFTFYKDYKVAFMDREEWMYKLPRVSNDMAFLHHVRKFVAAAKKHRVSLGREGTICPCNSCKNNLLQEDNVVLSHLIRYGFVKNYIVWKFHGEAEPSVTSASERNSSTSSLVNERGQQPSSSTATAGSDGANGDYMLGESSSMPRAS